MQRWNDKRVNNASILVTKEIHEMRVGELFVYDVLWVEVLYVSQSRQDEFTKNGGVLTIGKEVSLASELFGNRLNIDCLSLSECWKILTHCLMIRKRKSKSNPTQ
jgi:hypothetical protein